MNCALIYFLSRFTSICVLLFTKSSAKLVLVVRFAIKFFTDLYNTGKPRAIYSRYIPNIIKHTTTSCRISGETEMKTQILKPG